jgi:hypothetical protein
MMSAPITLIQHHAWNSSQQNKSRKRNKKHGDQKEKVNSSILQMIRLHRKSHGLYLKKYRINKWVNQGQRHRSNIKINCISQHSHEHTDTEVKMQYHLQSLLKKKHKG